MTGDIEARAMAFLLEAHPDLHAAVMEVPHHGSAKPAAYDFVARVNPEVAVQSTGARRLGDERWDHVKQGRRWWITAADGAVRVEVHRDGRIESAGWITGVPVD